MPQSLSAVYVHIVFSTKNRHPYLADPEVRSKLFTGIAAISNRLDCPAVAVGGVPDHVHILARQSRTITLADWVRDLKKVSSPWLKKRGGALAQFAWQVGYGAFSVDVLGIEVVREYIEGQEAHHKVVTFQDEFLRLLREHRVEWDDKHLWD